jgi:ketosteroid isomerase-like protein
MCVRCFNAFMSDDVSLVRAYIEATQRARDTQAPEDLATMRGLLADDMTVKMASPWTDGPWRIVITSADQLVARMKAPINRGSSLVTENVNLVQAGSDVLVEQLSTITRDEGTQVSMVCHIFTVEDGKIAAIRAYRNDDGLPSG